MDEVWRRESAHTWYTRQKKGSRGTRGKQGGGGTNCLLICIYALISSLDIWVCFSAISEESPFIPKVAMSFSSLSVAVRVG